MNDLHAGPYKGRHAVHFAAAMPWLTWQCSDADDNLPGIGQWLAEVQLPNTPPAFVDPPATTDPNAAPPSVASPAASASAKTRTADLSDRAGTLLLAGRCTEAKNLLAAKVGAGNASDMEARQYNQALKGLEKGTCK